MAKGFFSQGVSLLTDGSTRIEDIRSELSRNGFLVVKTILDDNNMYFSGPSLVVSFLPAVNGYASVDLVNKPWPDGMGDPKSEALLFSAWSMGYYGPYVFPGGLERAQQHSWAWQPGRAIAKNHQGFIRIKISYVFGVGKNAPVLPQDYDPLTEMRFLSKAVLALLNAQGVMCYFNPNGEVLRDLLGFKSVWDDCEKSGIIPLPLWSNIRFYTINEKLSVMDTVGNHQLDINDIEAIFPHEQYEPGVVAYYLRNVSHYLLDMKKEGGIKSGDSIDGPQESNLSWKTEILKQSIVAPPRQVLRLYPKEKEREIDRAIKSNG